jgi:LacI family transcriptional regulator
MVRRVTSKEVAERAGVSRAAVSLVLNGRGDGNIAPAKQEAIRAAARELQYTPNSVARSLRNQRTHTIGVVTDAIVTSAYGGGVLAGAIEVAGAAGYLLLVLDTGGDPEREAAAFEVLLARQVDGLVFAAMALRPYRAPGPMRELPAVLTNSYEPDNAVTGVACDEVGGGRAATRVLLDHGHRDIVLLRGTGALVAAQRRVQGFEETCRAAGLVPAEPVPAGWEIRDGYRAARQVLAGPTRPTGLICANDRVAVGAVLAARELGLDVPGDVSVVGYDDDENVAPVMVPALTTVAIPHEAMGAEAMRRLLSTLDGSATGPEQVRLPCPLIERASVAPPARPSS